eukprot:TRINITY_DN776182_c0_g1_i1.p1 TRINITY_DN776182_c0_g1~~TRINITY_DN776182_c0_g1_i1.p1  ORF type:complete len:218 (-),score=54.02 TRINITY_DN776182_c0_g1_i1:355-969(-)
MSSQEKALIVVAGSLENGAFCHELKDKTVESLEKLGLATKTIDLTGKTPDSEEGLRLLDESDLIILHFSIGFFLLPREVNLWAHKIYEAMPKERTDEEKSFYAKKKLMMVPVTNAVKIGGDEDSDALKIGGDIHSKALASLTYGWSKNLGVTPLEGYVVHGPSCVEEHERMQCLEEHALFISKWKEMKQFVPSELISMGHKEDQ